MDEDKDVLESETEQTEEKEVQDPSDKLTPEHPRFKEVIAKNHELEGTVKDLQTKLEDIQTKISEKQDAGQNTDEEELALQKIERRMRDKFATKDELSSNTQAFTFDKLSDKYNGSNGFPKFVPVDVVAYAKRNGFGSNYEAAYRDMHFDAIVQVRSKQGGNTPPTSEKPSGGDKQAETESITAEDISTMSDEEYEKNRDKILQAARPR